MFRTFNAQELAEATQRATVEREASVNAGSPCDAILVPKRIETGSFLRATYAYLKLVNQDNYSKYKANHSAEFDSYFQGEWNEFKESRERFFSTVSVEMTVEDSRYLVMTFVPAEQVRQWGRCMAGRFKGLTLWVEDVTAVGATVVLDWTPPAGLGPLRNISITIEGGTFENPFTESTNFTGEIPISVSRTSGEELRVTVKGDSGPADSPGTYSGFHLVPPWVVIPLVEVSETVDYKRSRFVTHRLPKQAVPMFYTVQVACTSVDEGPGSPWLAIQVSTQVGTASKVVVWNSGKCWDGYTVQGPEGRAEGTVRLPNPTQLYVPALAEAIVEIVHENEWARAKQMLVEVHGKEVRPPGDA